MARERVGPWMNWLLVAVFLALRMPALLTWSPTWDEPIYVGAGKYMLTDGDPRQAALRYHPPLAYHVSSLPLWAVPSATQEWVADGAATQVGLATLYESGDDPEKSPLDPRIVLTLARLPILLVGLLGMELVRRLGVRLFDGRTGWIAAAAWAVHPDVVAHGVLATTDLVAAVAAVYLAMTAVAHEQSVDHREPDRGKRLLHVGLAAGLALLAKHSLVVPLAVTAAFAILWRVLRKREGDAVDPGAFGRAVKVVVVAFAVLWAGYLFEVRPIALGKERPHGGSASVSRLTGLSTDTVDDFVESVPVPAATYAQSFMDAALVKTKARRDTPWTAYLDGQWSDEGFLAYFPVAFAVKTPTGLLLLIAVGLVGWWPVRKDRRRIPDYLLALVVIPFAAAVASRLNIGVRHLLPIVPFALLLGAAAVSRLWVKHPRPAQALLALIGLLVAGEWAVNFKDPLAFANVPSGGPARLHERLADSNLDWGQDFWAFVRWGQEEELQRVECRLFLPPGLLLREQARNRFLVGLENPTREDDIVGIRADDQTGGIPKIDLAAISETQLLRDRYRHLVDVEPLHRIGHIRIYRLAPGGR